MQDQEAPDLRRRHCLLVDQRAVDGRDVLRQQLIDTRVRRQLLVRAVDDVVALRPIADRGQIDVEHDADEITLVAEHHSLADVRIELELVLDVFRRNQRAIPEPANVFRAVDDAQVSGPGIEEAGVAGLDEPVLGGDLGGPGVVLEIADEHARRFEQHLTILCDAQLHVRHHRSDRIGEDLPVGLCGEIEERFGLAVELLQVQADRTKEREQVGPDGLAGRIGGAHAREPQNILERAVDQKLAELIGEPAGHRHRLAVENLFAVAARDRQEIMKHPPLQRAGILHPDHHARQHLLEYTRRGEVERRPDLLHVGCYGFAAFRTGKTEGRDQRLRVVQVMVADPGQRQIGERLILLGQLVECDSVGCRIDTADPGEHDALRLPGRARRVENDRRVGPFARSDLAIEPCSERRVVGERRPAVLDDVLDGMQPRMIVVAQPARFVIDQPFELRHPFGDGQNLVDLLLVLDRSELHVGVRQHVGQFLGDRVGVNRHRNGAERLRGRDRPVEPGPVRTNNRNGVAALEAETGQPDRICAHLGKHLCPGPYLPDAEILVPVRRPIGEARGVADQQLGKRIRLRAGAVRHRASLRSPAVRRGPWFAPNWPQQSPCRRWPTVGLHTKLGTRRGQVSNWTLRLVVQFQHSHPASASLRLGEQRMSNPLR